METEHARHRDAEAPTILCASSARHAGPLTCRCNERRPSGVDGKASTEHRDWVSRAAWRRSRTAAPTRIVRPRGLPPPHLQWGCWLPSAQKRASSAATMHISASVPSRSARARVKSYPGSSACTQLSACFLMPSRTPEGEGSAPRPSLSASASKKWAETSQPPSIMALCGGTHSALSSCPCSAASSCSTAPQRASGFSISQTLFCQATPVCTKSFRRTSSRAARDAAAAESVTSCGRNERISLPSGLLNSMRRTGPASASP
mmetsp:Transcript_6192/g.19841  ORF Transcript_6192/g.19841 Transcript_6192/m.19841 type:complete len:261 (-) Transcript_6192:115-897(-)